MSMLDVFLGYNQFLMVEQDKYKTAFTTPSRTYAYNIMPFRLKNERYTFQREMNHSFKDLIGKFMADYQDDLTVHSRLRQLHLKHLTKFFVRCRMYGIYLNPKKCLFLVLEG